MITSFFNEPISTHIIDIDHFKDTLYLWLKTCVLCLVCTGVSKNDHLFSMKAEVLARIPLSTYVLLDCDTRFRFVLSVASSLMWFLIWLNKQ
jgi:hypothetical protein